MEFSFILFILGFIVVAYLIFKLIKKIVFAIITFVVFILLIIGGVFGLVYLDYNYLAAQGDFEVHIIYGSNDNAQFGLIVPVENKSLKFESASSYKISDLSGIDLDNVEDDFYIFISENLMTKILKEDTTYYVEETENFQILSVDLETGLDKRQVLDIFSANSAKEARGVYIDEVVNQNEIPEALEENIKSRADDLITQTLQDYDVTLRQVLFLTIIKNSVTESSSFIKLVEGFKEKELEVYPDRFTFKLVRMLSVDTIKSFIPDFAME